MSHILVIVESPVKADKIQGFLGTNYTVIASMGHIADLAKGGTNGIGVDTDRNFKPKYVLIEDKVKVLNSILAAAADAKLILLAADGDREGEAIAWHVAARLAGTSAPIKRIVFNEIKKKAIIKAIKSPREIDMNVFDAQETRRILDRIVGFMASPFLMSTMAPKLSAGRVQSVVTRMVVDRELLIETFVPEDFWNINATFVTKEGDSFVAKYDGKISTKDLAKSIYSNLSKSKSISVTKVDSRVEQVEPPPPLVTSTLQRLMSKKFGMSADKTMKAAQSLYEQGYCTYIRTDSVRASEESIAEVQEYIETNYILPKKVRTFTNKSAAQDAHECIRPSDLSLKPDNGYMLSDPDQKKVYEMIWRRFIASQMMPAVYDTLKVNIKLLDFPEIGFKTSGKALTAPGFMTMLEMTDDSKISLPSLSESDILTISAAKVDQKQTKSKPRFSEDQLLKELELKNIGRPATYADLLSKVTSRNYVEKRGSIFHPTDLGRQVTSKLKQYFSFMNYNYTARLESQLDDIEAGKVEKLEVLSTFFNEFKEQLSEAYLNSGGVLCEKCKHPMVKRVNRSNGDEFLACSHYPHCKNTQQLKKAD